jgi:hypothetical protein
MTRTRAWLLLVGLMVGPAAVLAQFSPPPGPGAAEQRSGLDSGWVTEKMIRGVINKMADDVARRYGFDEDQRYLTRELFQERIVSWLEEKGPELQPVFTTYMESVLSDEPPTADHVAMWATQAQPLLDEFGAVMEDVGDGMREYMSDEQQLQLEGEMAAFQVGMQFVNQRMETWRSGGFDPESDWPGGRRFQQEEKVRGEELQVQMNAASDEAINSVVSGEGRIQRPPRDARAAAAQRTSDPWVQYVEGFIKKYELNAEQAAGARRTLQSELEQRDAYLRRMDAEIERVEVALKDPKTPAEDKARLIAQYDGLAKPVENRFARLKERLETLPTRAQRQKAMEKDAAAPAGRGTQGAAAPASPPRQAPE